MRQRHLWMLLATVLAAAAIGGAIYFRARGAPESARLLPEGDAIVFINLKPLRTAAAFTGNGPSAKVVHEPEYEEFIRETGFVFERDLDQAAMCVHPPEPATDGNLQRRFSEIFIGRFDAGKVTQYLHKLAKEVEHYTNKEVFLIPYEGRSVRVAILSVDTVAVSNTADAANIHGMIDRYNKIAVPFGGATLLSRYYRHIPYTSVIWAISRFATPDGRNASLPLPGGINFTLPRDTVTVASVSYSGGINFRAEAFTPSEDEARKLTESASGFLQLFRGIEINTQPRGPDPDVKSFFDSIRVEQHGERAVLSADLPQGFMKKILTEAPQTLGGEAGGPQPSKPAQQRPKK